MNEKEIEVHQMRDDKEISVENLKWPQKYEDFIKDIVQKFKLSKNALIESITLFTDDGDDNVISSKDDFNNFLETPLIKILFTAKGGEEIDDNNIIINPEPLKEIKIEEINIDDLMKDVFNIDEYKEQMNLDTKKFTQDFKNDLEKSINEILEENKKIAEKNIDLKLSQYIETSQEKDSNIKQSILNITDMLKEIREQTEGMSDGINELYGAIVNKEIFISKSDALGGVNNNEKLPPALEVNSRYLTEDRSAYLEMLPLSIEEAIECAQNSDFINNSDFADIAARYIETIKARV